MSYAHQLRAAGIKEISVDGTRVVFEPPNAPLPAAALGVDETKSVDEFGDPLNDPIMFPDGKVPGFRRARELAKEKLIHE